MVNPIVKLSAEVAQLRGRMAERLSNFEAVVDTVDPLVVTLPDGSQMEGLTPIGVQPRPGLSATVQVGEGRAWLLPHVQDGDPAPGELSEEVGGTLSRLELDGEKLSGGLLDVAQAARDFEVQYTLDQTAAAVELDDIRNGLSNALTADKFASLTPGDGLYLDTMFKDAALSATRATNTGMTYTAGSGLTGTAQYVWLTGKGQDEGLTIPLTVGDLYSVRVWGTGLTSANNRTVAVKWANGTITSLPTIFTADGMASTVVPTSAGARLLVSRLSGTASATITRVEIRHGIGGTLIEGGSINTDHLVTTALDFWEAVGMKLTSPILETNIAADRGMKIIGDRLTGYSTTGVLLIDIGGPEGIIKGVKLTGSTFDTASAGVARVLIDVHPTDGARVTLRSAYMDRPVVSILADDPLLGGGNSSISLTNANYTFPLLALNTLEGLIFNHYAPEWGQLGGVSPYGNRVRVMGRHGLLLDSEAGIVTVNGIEVAGRTTESLSSHMTLIRQGRVRELMLNATATLPEGNTTIFGTVPVADRPATGIAFGTAYMSGYPGLVFVNTAGVVTVTNRTGAAKTAARGSVTWTV